MPENRQDSSTRSLQARLAAASRWGTADRDVVAAEFATAKIARYIAKTVDAAPPLTVEQRARLAALLTPACDKAGDADAAA